MVFVSDLSSTTLTRSPDFWGRVLRAGTTPASAPGWNLRGTPRGVSIGAPGYFMIAPREKNGGTNGPSKGENWHNAGRHRVADRFRTDLLPECDVRARAGREDRAPDEDGGGRDQGDRPPRGGVPAGLEALHRAPGTAARHEGAARRVPLRDPAGPPRLRRPGREEDRHRADQGAGHRPGPAPRLPAVQLRRARRLRRRRPRPGRGPVRRARRPLRPRRVRPARRRPDRETLEEG